MTTETVERVVREFWHAYATLKFERALDLLAEDIVYEDVGINHTTHGREATRTMWMRFLEIADPAGFEAPLHDVFVTEDGRYAIEWSNRVRLAGRWMGYPVAGRTFEIRGSSVGRVEGGRIVAHRDYWNALDAFCQLGIREVPSPKKP